MEKYAILETGGKQYRVCEGDVIDVELMHLRNASKANLSYEVGKVTGKKMYYYLDHTDEWAELLNREPHIRYLYETAMKYNTHECDWDCRSCEWMKVVDDDGVEVMECSLKDYGIIILNKEELEEEEDEW